MTLPTSRRRFFSLCAALALALRRASAQTSAENPDAVIRSLRAPDDVPPILDPNAPFWRPAPPVFAAAGPHAEPMPALRTEIRSRWTPRFLYILYVCPYDKLYLHPNPVTTSETNKLWNWDVAEVFLGSDFSNIRQYKEFELSPQGEWVDLDIDLDKAKPEGGWLWNSGFITAARIDHPAQTWYGVMKIPFPSIDSRSPKPGLRLRANFYRMQGPPPHRGGIAWQPTHSDSYHHPEAFGTLLLTA